MELLFICLFVFLHVLFVFILFSADILGLFGKVEAVPLPQLGQPLHVPLPLCSESVSHLQFTLMGAREVRKDQM